MCLKRALRETKDCEQYWQVVLLLGEMDDVDNGWVLFE
jgi:hypothetical protein